MDSKEGRLEENSTNQKGAARIETKLKLRKRTLDEILLSKRIPPSLPKDAYIVTQTQFRAPEDIEDKTNKKEEPSKQKGKINMSNYKYRTRKSKKRCWICKSPNHCPKIKCFHCHKLGHVKEHCYKRKVDFIFNWLWKMNKKYRP